MNFENSTSVVVGGERVGGRGEGWGRGGGGAEQTQSLYIHKKIRESKG